MTLTLADYWAALCPELPPAWETPANRKTLAQMARRMAPIPRIGLECRLGDAVPTLDLQQCIDRRDGEPALLRDFVLAQDPAAGEGGGALAALLRFCKAWADRKTLLHQEIAEVFLEYDLGSAPQPDPTPSLFFALGDADTAPATRRSVAEEALALLLPASIPLTDNLERCLAACPTGAYVGYLGVMLGRPTPGLRVNVKRLRLDDVVPYLRAVGWRGWLPSVEHWAAWAYDRADHVTICLDVGAAIHPRLGLECGLTVQPPHEPRWHAVLEELSTSGLCSAENGAAFLSVPGSLRPPETQAGWPASWIAASLRLPADWFSTTERRLSHVKITVTGQHALLKGYWGAGHVWRRAGPPGAEEVEARRHLPPVVEGRPPLALPQPVPAGSKSAVGQALTQAIAFLLSQQAHTGRWSDFVLPAGPSDEWVTAFVAASLLETPAEAAHLAAQRAWRALLNRHRDEGGWGYNRLTPADADSTAWALRLAVGLRVLDERVGVARRFLDEHVVADGGITTYAKVDPIRRYTRLPESASFEGWRAAHACVTAAAAPLLGPAAAGHLAGRQQAGGHWQGYWWWDDEYVTALAAEALTGEESADRRSGAVAWGQGRVSDTGAVVGTDGIASPWATAWCVRVLHLGTTRDAHSACARAVRWLVDAQQPDGSWRASARLRVPMPGQVDSAGQAGVMNSVDQNRVFTTAAVVAALSLSAGGEREPAGQPHNLPVPRGLRT